MASQKDKYLNSAQKFLQKGQIERAIKDYEQVVTVDPKDVRHRQKLAELLARCNRNEEAAREYDTIAKYYEENGFYLKAIAVYKQIQKIDIGNIEICLKLAELNEKQGLIGNALSEYKSVYDHHEKAGLSRESFKILEKMHQVDPENIDIRLKLAETQFAAGLRDEAYAGYSRAALMLKSRGNDALFEKVCARINTLFPAKKEFLTDLLEEEIKNGSVMDIIPRLRKMLEKDEANQKLLLLLARACKAAGDMEESKNAWYRLLELYPAETAAKEGLIECMVEEGDLEESLKVLALYHDDLISDGSYAPLEKFYTSLQKRAPYDTRILEALKTLYEASGDQVKLADVHVSLNILSSNVSEEMTDLPEDEAGKGEAVYSAEGMPGITEIDFPWEEEIELSVPGEDAANASFTGGYGEELVLDEAPFVELDSGEEESGFEPDALELEEMLVTPEYTDSDDANSSELGIDLSGEQHFIDGSGEKSGMEELFDDSSCLELNETCLVSDAPENSPVDGNDWLSAISLDDVSSADEPEAPVASTGVSSTVADATHDLEGIFNEFKKGLDRQLEKGDTETHFNLGIAYKEMGLFDDAMKEFATASVDPLRSVDCVILLGICLREKGELEKAEEVLHSGINRYVRDPEKVVNLQYELGLLYEDAGRNEDALRVYRDVFAANPGFRDTVEKIAGLHGTGGHLDLSDLDEVDFELEELK